MNSMARMVTIGALVISGVACGGGDASVEEGDGRAAGATTAGALASSELPATHEAGAVFDYSRIGLHDSLASGSSCGTNCVGAFATLPELADNQSVTLAPYLRDTRVEFRNKAVPRKDKQGKRNARLALSSVMAPREIALRELVGGRAQVLAIFTVGKNSTVDSVYGLSSAVADGMDENFFLVAHDFDAMDVQEHKDVARIGPSRRVARWSLYGIRGPKSGTPIIEKLSIEGDVRWCAHRHAVKNKFGWAGFLSCKAQETVDEIARDADVMDALRAFVATNPAVVDSAPEGELGWIVNATNAFVEAGQGAVGSKSAGTEAVMARLTLLAQALNSESALAWFTCGVGCCIADVDM